VARRSGNSFLRRWLLYGVLASFLHLCAFWIFALAYDRGIITGPLSNVCDWLAFPGVWLHDGFCRTGLHALPLSWEMFYKRHAGVFFINTMLANSALWGFPIAAGVLYGFRRLACSNSPHDNAG
jgi:hypothetical protein